MMHWLISLPSPDLSPVVESAFRSLTLAVLVGASLKLLRVRNVVAQKASWLLVLGFAFAMPLLAPVASRIPGIPAQAILHLAWKHTAAPVATEAAQPTAVAADPADVAANQDASNSDDALAEAPPTQATSEPRPLETAAPVHATSFHLAWMLTRPQFLFLLYCGVALTLLVRLGYGTACAARLWATADPVEADGDFPGSVAVRSSVHIHSPLTIGSGILLPADYADWDREKLHIVLEHEASHIRQGDFYLQLAAALYSAVFWFSPLGWWLQHQLSDLSEAISDRAAVARASSRASYAQVLLQFAVTPRMPQIGVAMARPGRLTQRIERLLNDSSFHSAFERTSLRVACAVALVPVALFAATALVRVQTADAQQIQQPTPPAPPLTEPAPAAPASVTAPQPAAMQAPAPPAAPATVPTAPVAPAPIVTPAPAEIVIDPHVDPDIHILTSDLPQRLNIANDVLAKVGHNLSILTQDGTDTFVRLQNNNYGSHTHEREGEFYGVFELHGGRPDFQGKWTEGHKDAIDKAEKLAKGDFLLFTDKSGKSYYIDDPELVAQQEKLEHQVSMLSVEQQAMARAQEAIAREQANFAKHPIKVNLPKVDLQKELADLTAEITKLQAQKDSTLTQAQLSELQGKLGRMMGQLAMMQSNISLNAADWGRLQGELGARQGELGSRQGALGSQMSDLSREAEEHMKSIIQQALKDGKAKPVQ